MSVHGMPPTFKKVPKKDKRREASSRRLCGRAFRLPTRLAVGFGLEALPAFGRIHPGRWQAVVDWFPRDRKSTRLNSSHSQISYAVFCLKKKKKYRTEYSR